MIFKAADGIRGLSPKPGLPPHTIGVFMRLDSQAIAKLKRGERLDVDIPEVGDRCVVIRAIDFWHLLQTGQEGLSATIVTELVDAAMAEDDALDPLLAGYQSCRP